MVHGGPMALWGSWEVGSLAHRQVLILEGGIFDIDIPMAQTSYCYQLTLPRFTSVCYSTPPANLFQVSKTLT